MDWKFSVVFIIISILYKTSGFPFESSASPTINSNQIDEQFWNSALNYVQSEFLNFELGEKKEAVLLLGNSASHKNIIANYLAGDENNLPATDIETVYPVFYNDSETDYYDLPSINDSQDIPHDLAVNFFNKQLLNSVESIKYVFVIDANAFENPANRSEFLSLARYATTFIGTIEKSRDGISLIVSNKNSTNSSQLTAEKIADFLKSTRKELVNANSASRTLSFDRKINLNIIKFIDVLLEQENNQYHKINLLTFSSSSPKEFNLVKNLKYVSAENINTTISTSTLKAIDEIIEYVLQRLRADMNIICGDINMALEEQIKNNSDIQYLNELANEIHNNLTAITFGGPKKFLEQMINIAITLGSDTGYGDYESLSKKTINDETFLFLKSFTDNSPPSSLLIRDDFKKCLEPFEEDRNWYDVLVQTNDKTIDLDELNKLTELLNATTVNISGIQINQLISSFGLNQMASNSAWTTINSVEALSVGPLLSNLNAKPETTCSSGKLLVKGYNLNLKEIITPKTCHDAEFIEIFALNELTINTNIRRSGVQITMIAPIFNVINSPEIDVSGENGKNRFKSPAENGKSDSSISQRNGKPGQPGESGTSSGHFVGIYGDIKNPKSLRIIANGGHGGRGQDGGKGL